MTDTCGGDGGDGGGNGGDEVGDGAGTGGAEGAEGAGGNLGRVVRVWDHGRQLKIEVLVEGDDGLAKLDNQRTRRILICLVCEHRLEEWVERLEHILQ